MGWSRIKAPRVPQGNAGWKDLRAASTVRSDDTRLPLVARGLMGTAGRADAARRLLAAIRIVNGTLALVAPARLATRLGADPQQSPALLYALRMFGVRTVVIGWSLLRGEKRALRAAPIVHASDTVAAALAARSGRLPRRAGVLLTAISAANTLLALAARGGGRSR
jgi:hypothetical protein